MVLEKTLESPLNCKGIQPIYPKGDQSWVFIGRTDVKAETPILWPPHAKSWLIWKDPDAGRDWGQEEKGMTEDEMAGWHHWLNGYESEWTPGVGDGQGGLACCNSWGRKESDMTEWLIWSDLIWRVHSSPGSDLCPKDQKSIHIKPGYTVTVSTFSPTLFMLVIWGYCIIHLFPSLHSVFPIIMLDPYMEGLQLFCLSLYFNWVCKYMCPCIKMNFDKWKVRK